MLKILLLGILLRNAASALAQANFRPGYVIILNGDTLWGEVDSRGAQRNARLSRFRPSEAAVITEYQPRQLRGYGFVGDRVYQTESVMLADSIQWQSVLNVVADTLNRPSFLEVVVQGPASLLYLRDEASNDHYYLRLQGRPVQELVQTSQQVVENGVTYQRKSDDFRRTLAAATQQCLTLQPAITTVRYDQNGLIRIVRRYNECVSGVSILPASTTRKNHVQLGIIVGGERSQLVLNDNRFGMKTIVKGSGAMRPVVGLAFNLHLTGLNKAVSARVEALYENQKYLANLRNSSGGGWDYRVELAGIRVPLLIRYTYPKGAIRPFLQVGYGFSYLLKSENEVRRVYRSATANFSDASWRQIIAPRTLEQSIIGGIGLTTARPDKRNLAAELRYERSDGFSDASDFGSRVNRFYFLLSYDLTK